MGWPIAALPVYDITVGVRDLAKQSRCVSEVPCWIIEARKVLTLPAPAGRCTRTLLEAFLLQQNLVRQNGCRYTPF